MKIAGAFAHKGDLWRLDGVTGSVAANAFAGTLAFDEGKRFADMFENAETVASGLRVPKAIGDFLILDAIRASRGAALSVSDAELLEAVDEIGASEGLFVAPEGAACLPALRILRERKLVDDDERVVLFNTGAGIKYLEVLDRV